VPDYDLRERRRTRARLAIQTEAFRLFARQGYSETTVEQIADAAAISPRTFFRYFRTKEDVVMWDEYDPLITDLIASRPNGETPFESLRAVICTSLHDLYEHDPALLLARTRLLATVPEIRGRSLDLQTQGADLVARVFAKHRGLKSRQDAFELGVLTSAMIAAANVALQRWERGGGKKDPTAFVNEAFDALANAILRR
jgi:AcrR family transcriptional regulator